MALWLSIWEILWKVLSDGTDLSQNLFIGADQYLCNKCLVIDNGEVA